MSPKAPVEDRDAVLDLFARHVSRGKVDFYRRFGLDLVMGERQGCTFHDVDGRPFLNAHCNGGVFNMGHRHPRLIRALVRATERYDIGNHHLISAPRASLAQRLTALLPGDLDHVVFGVSGGEAIDVALKMARGLTGRPNILSAVGGYHGHTGLALATGDARYRDVFMPNLPGFAQVPFGDLDALADAVDDQTAAVLLEAVPATLGIVVPDPDYLQGVRRLCDDRGALFILDEVQTGLGRTGYLFAADAFDVVPDLLVLGKGLSGGLTPLAATAYRAPHHRIFDADPFVHISTFGGNELACAVALELLDMLEEPAFLDRVYRNAERLADGLDALRRQWPHLLVEVRQMGMMIGLVWRSEGCGLAMSKLLFDQGVFAVYSNNDRRVTQLLLPLVAGDEDVDLALDRLGRATAALAEPQMQAMAEAIASMV